MKYTRLEIPDLVLCEPKIHEDNRGFVFEAFKKDSFNNFLGFEVDFCQDNISYSKYGVIRGLHTNTLDFAQSKLVSVLQGKILDVAVDFRVGSPSFGKVISLELDSFENKQLFIPRGFLHGFSVISDSATFFYKCDNGYNKASEDGVYPLDQEIGIDWGVPSDKMIISEKDQEAQSFQTFKTK